MAGKFLLDTNIAIAALGSEQSVLQQIDDADQYFVSATVLGEMLYGAFSSAKSNKNRERLDAFIVRSRFLKCDKQTAFFYGEIKMSLRHKGKPIPENDIWIAASAQQHSLVLATRDAHFDNVDGISIANW